MKRNISDMLNEIAADDLRVGKNTPLSAKAIRQRTLERIGENKSKTVRWLPRAAVIAAILVSLIVTACAADTVFNDGAFFGGFFGKEFSEKQKALFVDMGQNFSQTVESNGTTITLLWGIADEDCMYLHFQVTAPDGVVLPDLPENQAYSLHDKNMRYPALVHYPSNDYYRPNEWNKSYVYPSVTPLADEDSTDNVKEFVVRIWKESDVDEYIFNGPLSKRLTFSGLFVDELRGKGCERLFYGNFEFDISINNENRDLQSITVDAGGVSYYNKEYDFTTTVNSVTITPLRIMVDCDRTEANNKYIFPKGGPIQIVMKDGTTIDAMEAYYDASAHWYPHPDSVVGIGTESGFDIPIVVDDIEYLIIGEEHIVEVP